MAIDFEAVEKEKQVHRTAVKRALGIIGIREIIDLCRDHAESRFMEACNAESKKKWSKVLKRLVKLFDE